MAKEKEEKREDAFMLRTRMKLQGVRRKLKTRDKLRKIKSKNQMALQKLQDLNSTTT